MRAPLPYESIAFLAFMRLPLLTSLFDSWVFILYISFLLRVEHCLGVGFLFFNLAHVSFHPLSVGWLVLLLHHCIVLAMISFTLVYHVITSGLAG